VFEGKLRLRRGTAQGSIEDPGPRTAAGTYRQRAAWAEPSLGVGVRVLL